MLTRGAAQGLAEEKALSTVRLLLSAGGSSNPEILIDRRYRIWVDGITWPSPLSA